MCEQEQVLFQVRQCILFQLERFHLVVLLIFQKALFFLQLEEKYLSDQNMVFHFEIDGNYIYLYIK